MMERTVNLNRIAPGAQRRRRSTLGICQHCGGDVRRVRDVYGMYRQCMQCGREAALEPAGAWQQGVPTADPAVLAGDRLAA